MTARGFVLLLLSTHWIFAQTQTGKTPSGMMTLFLQPNARATIHLGSGYVSSVRLPDDVSSIVIGDPSRFKAEHADAEPRLVFLKTVTDDAARSYALITTRSGEMLGLDLVGLGKGAESALLDLFIDCRRERRTLVVSASETSTSAGNPAAPLPSAEPDLIGRELERQRTASFPYWNRVPLAAAVGDSRGDGQRTIVGFSIVNRSDAVIEMLPPQVELAGSSAGKKRKQLKAQPVLVSEYRMTSRRIGVGERVDGVVQFERPAFKEAGETLRLRLARSDQVDHPLILPIPFTAAPQGNLP